MAENDKKTLVVTALWGSLFAAIFGYIVGLPEKGARWWYHHVHANAERPKPMSSAAIGDQRIASPEPQSSPSLESPRSRPTSDRPPAMPAPPVTPEPAPSPASTPAPTQPPAAKPMAWVPAMVSPASAPFSVKYADPIATRDDRFRVRFRLRSIGPDVTLFVTDHGDIDGFAAQIVESGATCVGGGNELTGVRRFRRDRRLADHVVEMTILPADGSILLSDEFICRGTPVRPGQTATATIVVNYISDHQEHAVQISMPERTVVAQAAF